jgi:hypothetical protein
MNNIGLEAGAFTFCGPTLLRKRPRGESKEWKDSGKKRVLFRGEFTFEICSSTSRDGMFIILMSNGEPDASRKDEWGGE